MAKEEIRYKIQLKHADMMFGIYPVVSKFHRLFIILAINTWLSTSIRVIVLTLTLCIRQ